MLKITFKITSGDMVHVRIFPQFLLVYSRILCPISKLLEKKKDIFFLSANVIFTYVNILWVNSNCHYKNNIPKSKDRSVQRTKFKLVHCFFHGRTKIRLFPESQKILIIRKVAICQNKVFKLRFTGIIPCNWKCISKIHLKNGLMQ